MWKCKHQGLIQDDLLWDLLLPQDLYPSRNLMESSQYSMQSFRQVHVLDQFINQVLVLSIHSMH